MEDKIQQLIEKYENMFNVYEEMYWESSSEDLPDVLEWLIADLKQLSQPDQPSEEVEIVKHKLLNPDWLYTWDCLCWNYVLWQFDKYCPRCWKKIKRLDP